MELPQSYKLFLASPSKFAPSILEALLPEDAPEPDVASMQRRLQESGLGRVRFEVATDPRQHGAVWRQTVRVAFEGHAEPAKIDLSLQPVTGGPPPMEGNRWISDEERSTVERSKWSVSAEMQFGDEPLADYHRQLRVLAAAAPDAPVVVDLASTAVRPGTWVRDVASSSVPPSPLSLFEIHAVGPQGSGNGWLHTHGLLRCGLVELEMVDVPGEAAETLGELMNTVASAFLDLGLADAGETFSVGAGLDMVWLPWEEGIKHAPAGMWSEQADREQGHSLPSGILFRPPSGLLRKRYGSPVDYQPMVEENPIVWISDAETERMTALSRERFGRFAALQARFGADEENWMFLVKLGLSVDAQHQPRGEAEAFEHLWFQVHTIAGDQMDATLINQPYSIARLNEGQRGRHDLAPMSDWTIMCEEGRFGPDTVGQLERLLEGSE
jgi:uncharacterized protein YegJ (DUF2314 family)